MIVLLILKHNVLYKRTLALSVLFTSDVFTNVYIFFFVVLQPKIGPKPPRFFLGI